MALELELGSATKPVEGERAAPAEGVRFINDNTADLARLWCNTGEG